MPKAKWTPHGLFRHARTFSPNICSQALQLNRKHILVSSPPRGSHKENCSQWRQRCIFFLSLRCQWSCYSNKRWAEHITLRLLRFHQQLEKLSRWPVVHVSCEKRIIKIKSEWRFFPWKWMGLGKTPLLKAEASCTGQYRDGKRSFSSILDFSLQIHLQIKSPRFFSGVNASDLQNSS